MNLQSNYDDKNNNGVENNEEINSLDDFLFRGSVYVIAADNKSTDTVLCLCK